MDFDNFSQTYADDLNTALAVTGETRDYFAAGRCTLLKQELSSLNLPPQPSLMDFGCGTGGNTASLISTLSLSQYVGIDPSQESIDYANRLFSSDKKITFLHSDTEIKESFDLIYCNGVFHHIPVDERDAAWEYIYTHITPGGYFCIFENNPINPGTQLVMSRCPFDKDAITLMPSEIIKRGRACGFKYLRTRYTFFFPAFLKVFRFMEPSLAWCPLGAQYLTLFQKPK